MLEVVIRNFSINDFEGINVLMDQVNRLHIDNRPDIYRETDKLISKKDFLNMLNDDNIISIVAEINYTIVGLCIVSIRPMSTNKVLVPRRVAYMEDLCVHQEYRKQGIGKKLFIEAKKRALEFNADSLELMVWEFNKNAVNFYENEGMSTRSRTMEINLQRSDK